MPRQEKAELFQLFLAELSLFTLTPPDQAFITQRPGGMGGCKQGPRVVFNSFPPNFWDPKMAIGQGKKGGYYGLRTSRE